MDIIYEERGSGKTTKLIQMSHDTWTYIVTTDRKRADYIFRMARDLGIDIPNPVSWDECKRDMFEGSFIKKILIDDADDLLKKYFTQCKLMLSQ